MGGLVTQPSELAPRPARLGGRGWRFWAGALLSLACLAWIAYATDWPTIWQTLKQTDYRLVLVALGLNLASIPLRSRRWQLLFPPRSRPPYGRLTAVMLIGQALNVIFPARLGDVARATLVGTERTSFVMGTLVIQTVLDLLISAALVLVLLLQVTLPGWWRGPGQALLLTAVVALAAVMALAVGRRQMLALLTALAARWPRFGLPWLAGLAEHFLRSFDVIERPRSLIAALSWSVLIWIVYGMVNTVLLAAVGIAPSLLAAFFVLVVLQLSIAVPSSPGRIGVYHYLCVQALAVFGVNESVALSYAILLHMISVVVPIILGALLAWQMDLKLTLPAARGSKGW